MLKEQFRDKSRDELAYSLNSVGVKAKMAERDRPEEEIENSWYQRSLGVIFITEGPIRWINILKKDGSDKSPARWWVVLGIPDEKPISTDLRSARHQEIKIKTVRKKTFPLFGKVVGVTWKGKDGGTSLVNMLTNDVQTETLAKRIGNLEIKSQADKFKGWTLTVDKRFRPTIQDWGTFERIADQLLSTLRLL